MRVVALAFLVLLMALPALSGPVRIKDLVEFDGVRGNDL
ncbi:MAG: flagellar basal body P-ring protein FlgI, partial [Pseudomonadota bacterium]